MPRKITAQNIHDGFGWLPEGSAIMLSDDGEVLDIVSSGEDAEYFDGVLTPGFVNAHCHMELSHMKGRIPEGTGLVPFLQQVTFHRNDFTEEQKTTARHEGYDELIRNGVVAVGDIANSNETLDLRARNQLYIHTLVECIGFTNTHARARFDYSKNIYDEFAQQSISSGRHAQSIVPHAPYSVSEELLEIIDRFEPEALLSMHNQESPGENRFYMQGTGPVIDLLDGFGIQHSFFSPSGLSSLQTLLPIISPKHPLLLVHNTYTSKEDVEEALLNDRKVSFCLCPNANLYIESCLPDIDMLAGSGANICIGTDSLASNHQLCILTELITIKDHYPGLEWELLLKWATSGGAEALQITHFAGSIAKGKKPGINQISGLMANAGKPLIYRIV